MLFSIIVPVYNVEKYLHQCIGSALSQTCADFELILVDDGSKDNSGHILDDYAAADSRVIAIHKQNGGPGSARKAGCEVAQGEYTIILDGDDWLVGNALERIAKCIKDHHPDMVCYGNFVGTENCLKQIQICDEELVYTKEDVAREYMPALLLGTRSKCITPTLWGKAFKRSLYQNYQFTVDDRITMGEDGMVVYPCLCAAESICFLPDALYCYRENPDSLTRSKKKLIPWEGVLLRVEHLKRNLPLDRYNLNQQLGCYTAHAVFNVILTQMMHRRYREVAEESSEMLNSGNLMELICCADYIGSKKEIMAQFALRNRCFWLIKLYALLTKK